MCIWGYGFLKVYSFQNEDEEKNILPEVKSGEKITLGELIDEQHFTSPPPRYSEASLVKKMEELGIGRPSTYAPTVSTIQKRTYVEKMDRDAKVRTAEKFVLVPDSKVDIQLVEENYGAERKKLFPSDIGRVVTDFLIENFADILDYNFTAKVEKEFDDIAGSFNGSDTTFSLTFGNGTTKVYPLSVNQITIAIGGILQNAGNDYTISGDQITFTTAPDAGLTFQGMFYGSSVSMNSAEDSH